MDFTGGEIIPWHVLAAAEVIKIIANFLIANPHSKLSFTADVEESSGPKDINDTMLEEAIQTMSKTTIADVNNRTISEENSLQFENASEVVNTTNSTSASSELPKYFCKGRNNSLGNGSVEQRVIIVKADELMQWINTTEDNETDTCAVVLFYTEYCPFCAKLAPLYNALGRVYNNLPVLAVDAYKQHR